MYTDAELALLKADLGRTNPTAAALSLMQAYLTQAETALEDKGLTIDHTDTIVSGLIVSYAAWLYRKRDTGEALPRMVQYGIRNALITQKLADDTEDDDTEDADE